MSMEKKREAAVIKDAKKSAKSDKVFSAISSESPTNGKPNQLVTKRKKSSLPSTKKSKRSPRPPRAVRLSQAERRMQPRYNSRPDRIGVSVTLNLPRMSRITGLSRRQHSSKLLERSAFLRRIYATAQRVPIPIRLRRPILTILALAFVFFVVFSIRNSHSSGDKSTGKVAAAAVRTKPDFKPLIPSAADASSTTYDGSRNLVSYATSFSGARLTVSQQPLPAQFLHDPLALKTAADSINARQRLDTTKGPVYIATNDQGDQLAIFAGPQVLLFIHSERKLDDASWKSFIQLLAVKS